MQPLSPCDLVLDVDVYTLVSSFDASFLVGNVKQTKLPTSGFASLYKYQDIAVANIFRFRIAVLLFDSVASSIEKRNADRVCSGQIGCQLVAKDSI